MAVSLPVHRPVRQRQGFTLLEVLMAISVIVILMAIIMPAIGGAQNSAKRAKTRVQFSQWSAAIEQFRQEYGYYPSWGTGNDGANFENGLINDSDKTRRFVECLSGRHLDGTAITSDSAPGVLAGNTKRIAFCSFGTSDLNSSDMLQDAFGNPEIRVLLDRNLDGSIDLAGNTDYTSAPSPLTIGGLTITPPTGNRIRAGVAFYSAGDGQTPVTSW